MSKTAYILIGDANTGKSSYIRCVSGASPFKNEVVVRNRNNKDITLWTKQSALQELPDWLISPAELIALLNRYDYCLIALRFQPTKKCPHNADEYVQLLSRKKWDLKLVILGNNHSNYLTSTNFTNKELLSIQTPVSEPANFIAIRIRKFFDWH